MTEPAGIHPAMPGEIAATYDDEAAAAGPSPEAREAWREAVRSGDLDRWPHPMDCLCRECAVEEAGE